MISRALLVAVIVCAAICAALCAVFCTSDVARAEDCPTFTAEEMMQNQGQMMALITPGPEHELIAKMAGEWTGEVTMWMMPGAPPVTETMEQVNELVLGGRFLSSKATGSMMGMTVESFGMTGYDRRHEVYTIVGFDTMGTYYITASGALDPETNTITYVGTDEDPIAGLTQKYEFIHEIIDDDTYKVMLIFHCPTFGHDGPFKMMEQTMTRKKS